MIRVDPSGNHPLVVESECAGGIAPASVASHDGVAEESVGSMHVIEHVIGAWGYEGVGAELLDGPAGGERVLEGSRNYELGVNLVELSDAGA